MEAGAWVQEKKVKETVFKEQGCLVHTPGDCCGNQGTGVEFHHGVHGGEWEPGLSTRWKLEAELARRKQHFDSSWDFSQHVQKTL